MKRRMNALFLTIIMGLVALWAGGCTRMTVSVRSEPSDARVYFDGADRGVTPTVFSFKQYGQHEIRLEKEGYRPVVETVDLMEPLHMKGGGRLLTSMVPATVEDKHELFFVLKEQ